MKHTIYINYNFTARRERYYEDVLEDIHTHTLIIETNCLDFFSFTHLKYCYDIIVRKYDGSTISAIDLLQTPNQHTYKEITITDNIHKMLVEGSLTWKPL